MELPINPDVEVVWIEGKNIDDTFNEIKNKLENQKVII